MMEQNTLSNLSEFEEGEISDDGTENLYTPLERPHIPVAPPNKQPEPSESDDDNTMRDSSSDSDSSMKKNSSKMRKMIMKNQSSNNTVKKKNYNIWSSDIQTDILTDSLTDCNVNQANQRVRDVESYNYRLKVFSNSDNKFMNNNSNSEERKKLRYTNKRKHNRTFTDNKQQIQDRIAVNESQTNAGNPRNILNLCTTVNSTESEIATDIANKLFEEKEDLILRAVNILGKEQVMKFFEETRQIEADGGMLIMNGTRRRTPGGVFFYLVKSSDEISREKINEVFFEDKKSMIKNKKLTANERKKTNAAKFKEALSKDDFPTLLSRTELAIKEFKAKRLAEESSEVVNPPPSPATDGRDCSSDGEEIKIGGRKYLSQNRLGEDDLVECEEENMDSD